MRDVSNSIVVETTNYLTLPKGEFLPDTVTNLSSRIMTVNTGSHMYQKTRQKLSAVNCNET